MTTKSVIGTALTVEAIVILSVQSTAGRDWFPKKLPPGVRFEFSTFHGKIMAETVVGMMLSHARGLLRAHSLQRNEPWPNQTLEPGLRLLKRSRVTVLGLGHIGNHIGRLAKCFGAMITGIHIFRCTFIDSALFLTPPSSCIKLFVQERWLVGEV